MKKIAICGLTVILLSCITNKVPAQFATSSLLLDAGVSTNSPIQTKIFYNKKGRQTGMIRYYTASELPYDVKHQVKAIYYEYDIFQVTEVTVGNKVVYLVKIKNERCTKTVRVANGEMEVVEEFDNL